MKIESSEEYFEKRLVELNTLLQADHPCIVDFEGAYYNDGVLSFVLEFCDRGTIADLLEKVGRIEFDILGKFTHDLLGTDSLTHMAMT